uniref:trinucleotide repeat-containing gene 6A protein-like n=1 Tax=Pristiophorus japonicus TaxID=55135 RepID=UPI00398ED40A
MVIWALLNSFNYFYVRCPNPWTTCGLEAQTMKPSNRVLFAIRFFARGLPCLNFMYLEVWDRVQEKEEQLMEERKKRKDDKKKKEAALKKAIEQKNKVPEPTKTSQSQPQPANPNSGTSTTTSNNSNAKRVPANTQQQALSRYPPREVPPRFRHQEQKQLLKRGQQLPSAAGTAPPVLTSQSGGGAVAVQPVTNGQLQYSSKTPTGMPPIRDLVSHSPNQSGD